ncbi:MAG: hypothetical protein KAG98_05875 [Lentisphaeria bacterium]|nr:hypothetical protein [Lentisphaeria bacterium]
MFKQVILLIVFLQLNTNADQFYNFFKKHTREELYSGLSARYKINYDQKLLHNENYIKIKRQFGMLSDGYVHLFPIGPIQAWGMAIPGKSFIVLFKLEKDGVGESAGLQAWDEIHAVNGTQFTHKLEMSKEKDDGPVKEFGDLLELAQETGQVNFSVVRDGKPLEVVANVEQLGCFNTNFPVKDKKSEFLTQEILEQIRLDGLKPFCSNGYSNNLMGVALLSAGDPKYLEAIEAYLRRGVNPLELTDWDNIFRISQVELKGGLAAWLNSFRLIFFSEYFWATGDERIFPALQRLVNDTVDHFRNPFGAFGHNREGLGTYNGISFGPVGGLNILGVALAEKCGVKVDHQIYVDYYRYLSKALARDINGKAAELKVKDDQFYSVDYYHCVVELADKKMGERAFNTATAALALYNMPIVGDSKKLAKKFTENLSLNPQSSSYIHSTPSFGLFWTTILQSGFDKEGLRESLDYRKFWLTLSRTPNDFYFYFYPKRARMGTWGTNSIGGGWDGDRAVSLQAAQLYSTSVLLTSDRKNLLCQGNVSRNWLNPNIKPAETEAYIQKYHTVYAKSLLLKATKFAKAGDHVKANLFFDRLTKLYASEAAHAEFTEAYAGFKNQVGSEKLESELKGIEKKAYVDYLNNQHRLSDSYRKKLLKYVDRIFKESNGLETKLPHSGF